MPSKITQYTILLMAKEALEQRIEKYSASPIFTNETIDEHVSWLQDVIAQLNAIEAINDADMTKPRSRGGYARGGIIPIKINPADRVTLRKGAEEKTPMEKAVDFQDRTQGIDIEDLIRDIKQRKPVNLKNISVPRETQHTVYNVCYWFNKEMYENKVTIHDEVLQAFYSGASKFLYGYHEDGAYWAVKDDVVYTIEEVRGCAE